MLEIIPAIDLMGGQAVRLKKGDFATKEKVAEDPIATARAFAQAGAHRIHIVDLDGARTGSPENHDVIAEILKVVNVPVQVGGGLRTPARVEAILALGAARAVVGTSAAKDPDAIAEILEKYGEQVIVGADMHDGFVATHGWNETSGERVEDFGKRMVALGARRFLFTDVSRDGLLQGVNAEATAAFAHAVGAPAIASGGVADIQDIKNCARLQPSGIEGVIIGKALYAGRLTLEDALGVNKP
ncbi:MAG: 1-(5-phosphoribosyl)-5-[(5-phosphoribosylamino)methylideneamino]imidazole-4-carboxamide isomerase [Armatimonas sp.]